MLLLLPLLALGLTAAPARSATSAVSLPKDESPHPDTVQEWWYFNGHLSGVDPSGASHQYGFLMSFIRSDPNSTEPASALYNGQFAITDLTRGTFTSDMSQFVQQPDVVPAQGGFNNTVNKWNMHGINGRNTLTAAFADNSYGISLTANQYKPFALHGNGGVIPYGPFGESYYYSQTDLQTFGTVMDHGVPVTVTGVSWQDHQWGHFVAGTGGWTWFSVQLANDTQYMIYLLHDASGNLVQKVGTRINPGGSTVNLDPGQITSTVLKTWTSPVTGSEYPTSWKVGVPGGQFTITALEQNQELTIPTPNGPSGYWEGNSTAKGAINGVPVSGQAYAEITPNFTMP